MTEMDKTIAGIVGLTAVAEACRIAALSMQLAEAQRQSLAQLFEGQGPIVIGQGRALLPDRQQFAAAAGKAGPLGGARQTLAQGLDDRLVHALAHSFGECVGKFIRFGIVHR